MASIRNLKKNVNNVFGDIIDAVLVLGYTTDETKKDEATLLIQEIFDAFDVLFAKINQKNVENRAKHLKEVNKYFEEQAVHFVEKLNQL